MYSVGSFAFLLVNNIGSLVLVLALNALLGGITVPAYKTLFTHEEVQEQDFSITKQTTSPMYLDGEFIGKVAQVYASNTGGTLTRGEKHDAVTGTKGYKFKIWSDYKDKKDLDMTYYHDQLKKAINAIDAVGSAREFLPDLDDILKRESVPF